MSTRADNLPAELFRLELDTFPHPTVIATAADGRIVFANQSARSFYRSSGVHELVGKTGVELGFWSSEAQRQDHLRLARQPDGYVTRFDIPDDYGADLLTSHCVTFEGTEYVLSSLVDITSVLKIEEDLADALDRLRNAQALGNLGDFVADLDLEHFNGSAEAMRILGFPASPATISTRELFSHFPQAYKRDVAEAVGRLLGDGEFEVEHPLELPDSDDERWVYTRATVATDSNGAQFVRGTVLDVTERKRAEFERQRLHDKMQESQRLESLGLLSGGIAHDFNNLLTGVLGNAEFALLESQLPEVVRARLNDIVTAARRAADLTRQLLAYSGKGRFVVEAVDLSALIVEISELLSVTIGKDKKLQLSLPQDLPSVEADATQIRQILMNLIINASEAIDHGNGLISVSTGAQTVDEAYVNQLGLVGDLKPGRYVYFEVSDNGIGMTDDTAARLFDPFFTTKFTGRGLGMAATQGIVRGHEGAIKVYSELGRGSTFKVFLPRTSNEPAALATSSKEQQEWQGSAGVLVVDDEATPRDFACRVLERYGYNVFVAHDGLECLEMIRRHPGEIQLVLLDLTMPGLDGRETFAALRQRVPDVTTLLMSGYNEQDATQEFVGRGLAGFLAKPFAVHELMDAVVKALRER